MPADIHLCFTQRLSEARLAKGLTQAALGMKIGLAEQIASTRINRYERGASEPDLWTIQAMAKVLGVRVSWLVCTDPKLAALIEAYSGLPPKARDALLTALEAHGGRASAPLKRRPASTAKRATPSRFANPLRRKPRR